MALANLLQWLNPRARRAEKARQELMANAQKALQMKQEAGPQTSIPEHRTAHQGMRPTHVDGDSASLAPEGGFTPQLKRSHVARSGDT